MTHTSETVSDYYQALYRVAGAIGSTLEISELLEVIGRSVTEAMHLKACVIRLLAADGRQLELAASHGLSPNYLGKGPVDVEHSSIDREVLAGRHVSIPDVSTTSEFQYPREAAAEGLVSVLNVPMQSKDAVIGVMRVYTGARHDFSEEEIDFLRACANLAALAIENARLYERVRQNHEYTMEALWGFRRG